MSENLQISSDISENQFTTIDSSNSQKDYFMIKIHVNQQESVNVNKIKKYGLDLTRKERKHIQSSERKQNKAILYDIKGNYLRIWGNVDLVFRGSRTAQERVGQDPQDEGLPVSTVCACNQGYVGII